MQRQLTSIMGNSQQLDGGAMFGNVPKAMWAQWLVPDDQNRVTLACRALLIREANRNILLETGIGAFFEPKLKTRFGIVETHHVLLDSLQTHGLTHKDINIVILSHLHFDHAGGLLSAWQADHPPTLLFPNAQYVVSEVAWERACHPHPRDKASFVPHLNQLLTESGRVVIVKDKHCDLLGKDYHFHFSDGHTPGLLMTEVTTDQGPIIFVADLIPGMPWVHVPITMGYDRFAEKCIDEKQALLKYAQEKHARLFYTHDPDTAVSRITQDEQGRFIAVERQSELG